MACNCTKSFRDIYCGLHGDEQYKKAVTKSDKKVTKSDDKI